MRLTEDNCEVAYCSVRSKNFGKDKEIIEFAVKLRGKRNALSLEHCDYIDVTKQIKRHSFKVKLSRVAKYLTSQPKPILLVSSSSSLLLLKQVIQKYDSFHIYYGIIAGLVDAISVLKRTVPSRMGAENNESSILARKVLREEHSERMSNIKYAVEVLERVVTTFTHKSELITFSESFVEAFLRGLDVRQLNEVHRKFHQNISMELYRILKKMEKSTLQSFSNLKRVFGLLGSEGIKHLLTDREDKGERRINDEDRIMLEKLRWIYLRQQQCKEENPFQQENEDIDFEGQIPVNQIAVNQVPINQVSVIRRVPDNEYPMNWVPVDQDAVVRGPVNQISFGQDAVVRGPVNQISFGQDAVVRVPANRIPVNEYPINWVLFDQNPNYQGFVDRR